MKLTAAYSIAVVEGWMSSRKLQLMHYKAELVVLKKLAIDLLYWHCPGSAIAPRWMPVSVSF